MLFLRTENDKLEREIKTQYLRLIYTLPMVESSLATLVRHEADAPSERSSCGLRHLMISRQDSDMNVAAWAHTVDIDGARAHYHKIGTELYYVLEGGGSVMLDGVEHPVYKGSIVHIAPGVVHSAKGRMRVLVIGIPNISEDDIFFPED
jgi:mannose-6-phosphate isomerase-like protein (cupin superfamily)